jgi:hypothetical protein
MADLVLVRFDRAGSRVARRALVERLRETALAVFPKGGRQGKVGTIGGARFKVTLRAGEGAVDAQGARFDLDEPDFAVVRLVYELAKAGGMAWVDSWAGPGTVVFDRAAVKGLPAALRRPRPAVCTSLRQLARMMGVPPKDVAPDAEPDEEPDGGPWTRGLDKRSRPKLPGLDTPAQEGCVYVQILPDEDVELMMKRLWAFIRAGKRGGKLEVPTGGGIAFNHWDNWQVRLPAGQVLVPWHLAGYESRPNADHLVPANLEGWLSIARDFARASRRKSATIADGKTLAVRGGGRYPIGRLQYRRFEVD